jgi:hypothetical protein
MIIPKLPIIRFPRWPRIVLNLSDIRMGIRIRVPDFQFNIAPLRLPDLPRISLPGMPTAGLVLPSLPVLSFHLTLPEIPDLPSFPRITLPPLPPPPKLPEIFGAVKVFTNIAKLIVKMRCYYNSTTLVPEWNVGDVIAQRTERQGISPLDYIRIQYPQLTLPTLNEIRVSSHVNIEIRSDFITEFARAAVKPVNNFNTDFSTSIPPKIAPDVNISTPQSIVKKVSQKLDSKNTKQPDISPLGIFVREIEAHSGTYLDTDNFRSYLHSQYVQM